MPAAAAPVRVVAPVAATQNVDFLIHLPLRNSSQLDGLIRAQSDRNSPSYHHFLTPAQFRAEFGPSADTVSRVVLALRSHGITVTAVRGQMIHARGPAALVERAFATHLALVKQTKAGTFVAAPDGVTVPRELSALGATVAGLAPTRKPEPLAHRSKIAPSNRYSPFGSYWFDDLKQAYDYPAYTTANGRGVTIATVGESDYSSDDAATYFAQEGLGPGGLAPLPNFGHLILPGAQAFDPSSGASFEADVDVQQAAGSAPGASVVGVSVGGPEAFLEAYSYLDEANIADIVSTSYGECELYYTAAYNGGQDYTGILQAYHDLFRQGNAEGITFVFSSGDQSGLSCFPPGYFNSTSGQIFRPLPGAGIWVDDPNVTSVGGTNLVTTFDGKSTRSAYVSENEIADIVTTPVDWDGTGNGIAYLLWGSGGGVSTLFGKPAYQNLVATGASMRAEPDVAMHMGGCPYYGPSINVSCAPNDSSDVAVLGGALYGAIGTSAASPEFAGLLAIAESQLHTRLGNVNNDIYYLAAHNDLVHAFHQGIPSFNGVYAWPAGRLGYNTTVGVGTPIGKNFLLMPLSPAAGDPQTATNP